MKGAFIHLRGGFEGSLQHGWSTGFGQELSQALGWGVPAERFAWAAVELGGDRGEVVGAVDREVAAFGEVLA